MNDSAKTTEKISELNHEPVKANRRTVEGIRIDDLSMVFALDFFLLIFSKGALVQHNLRIKALLLLPVYCFHVYLQIAVFNTESCVRIP